MKTQKQFNDLCKAITAFLAWEQLDLDSVLGNELLAAMFPPSPERDIDPGLLEEDKKRLKKLTEDERLKRGI